MESEARLVMIDGGLPEPLLQHEIIDLDRRCWRVNFVWPQWNLVVEHDGFDWRKTPDDLRRDRRMCVGAPSQGQAPYIRAMSGLSSQPEYVGRDGQPSGESSHSS